MPSFEAQCQSHQDQIVALKVAAAETSVHLSNINQTLNRLDKKLDALDTKVEGLMVSVAGAATAKSPSKIRVDNWKAYAAVAVVSALIAWGPNAVAAIAAVVAK